MAPSSGHHLVPKAFRILRSTINQATHILRPNASSNAAAAQRSIQTASSQKRIPVHPLAVLKQSRPTAGSRSFASSGTSSSNGGKTSGKRTFDRSNFPVSRTSQTISRSGASPFASTLRPNLTGGALPRTAGGYSLGIGRGGARHFSHTSGCQAQVLQNVSAGIRAFFVNGGKVRYDGVDEVTGEKKWKVVGKAEGDVYQKLRKHSFSGQGEKWQPRQDIGTSLDFHISPTITAFLSQSSPTNDKSSPFENDMTLQTTGLLPALSMDFARALHDLSLIYRDLDLLSQFGALPFTLLHHGGGEQPGTQQGGGGPVLRVRFPGCDADAVTRLCDEVGVKRGIVVEDEEWCVKKGNKEVDMALLFPFAPSSRGSDADGESAAGMGGYFTHKQTPRAPPPPQQGSSDIDASLHSISHTSTQYTINPALVHDIDINLSTIPSLPSSSSGRDLDMDLEILSNIDLHQSIMGTETGTGTDIFTPSHLSSDDYYNYDYDQHSISPSLQQHQQHQQVAATHTHTHTHTDAADYEGMQGIYRFLQECDEAAAARRS